MIPLLVLTFVLGLAVAYFLIPKQKSSPKSADPTKACLVEAQKLIRELIKKENCHPILVRAAWHDSGTFNKNAEGAWPAQNGAVGTIRFDKELTAGPNAGLKKVMAYLKPIKEKCPLVSWADLLQMGSAEAIAAAGGPKIDMIYGRQDACGTPAGSEPPFGLPDALPSFGGPPECADDPAAHLRYVFGKYGMGDMEIVALSGAHTIGRAFKDRSGTVECGYASPNKYTGKTGCPYAGMAAGDKFPCMKGGKAWTPNFLTFDNSYFKLPGNTDPDLIAFPTDKVLATDAGFKPYFDKYAASQAAFFADYKLAHKKLSELGSKFEPAGGITL